MAEPLRTRTFPDGYNCDLCGLTDCKMVLFAATSDMAKRNFLMWYVCFRCMSGRIPTTEEEPSHGVD